MKSTERAAWAGLLAALAAPFLAGCGTMPRYQLSQCRERCQALQTETAQLKDESLGLRSKNRELAQRSLDDAHHIRSLEQDNGRLESSLLAYQQERDRMLEAYDQLQRQIRSAATEMPTRASLDRFETFARAHPGCQYDAAQGVWRFPAAILFAEGSAEFKPEAKLLLDAFSRLLADPQGPVRPNQVIGRAAPPEVIRTAAGVPGEPCVASLAKRRADCFRDRMATDLSMPATSIASKQDTVQGMDTKHDVIEVRFTPSS